MESIAIKHPDSEEFIDAKMTQGKVTGANVSVRIDDEFMNAATQGTTYTTQYPVESVDPVYSKEINASKLWKKIVHNAWKSAEPGILFWDTIIKESIPDCYADLGFKTVSTNPCLAGDTIIAVADGRNGVTIKELAEEGVDVPVYSTDPSTGQRQIKWGRNPRMTKELTEVWKLTLDDGSELIATPDHKIMKKNLSYVELKDLKKGDSLNPFYSFNSNGYREISSVGAKMSGVESVEYYGTEDVYNITVDDNHNYDVITKTEDDNYITSAGITVKNCGEITLCPNDSCRLLAINLYGYVINPFTENAYFDWGSFKDDVIISEKLMDDIVDLELEKIDKIIAKIESDPEQNQIKSGELQLWKNIKDKATRGRRTGLGVTAEGDMIAALGLKYGTDEANDFSEEVHKQLKLSAYRSSVIMAKERGTFPMWDSERETNNPFLLRIAEEDPQLYKDMMTFGRRNLALLTIAPTGSVSIMCQTSSGIECVFLPYYTRRRKINPQENDVRIDFTDEVGDHWMEYPVFHHKFETWIAAQGLDVDEVKDTYTKEQIDELVKESPYWGATSNDVNWVKKVEMQGRIQKHVDHSISVTVNLPNDISEEKVGEVYEMGWRSGCFKEGNGVYTKHGIKDISQITVGDEVYGHDGRLHIVDEIYDLPEETRKFVRFKLNGYQSIESTSEHPFLVIELDESENKKSWDERTKKLVWKKADEIKLNDHLVVPNNFENNNKYINRLDLSKYVNCDYLIEKDEIFLSRILPWKENKMVKSANSKSVPRYVDIDEDLSYFIGWFIAEGHFSSESYVRFTLNLETEVGVANKLIAIGKEKFNLDGYKEIKHSNGGVSLTVQFGSRLLSNIMRSFCGQYSDNKHLPEWFMEIKPELLKTMIDCHYNGDKGVTISDRLNRELLMARNILNERIFASDNYGQGYEVRLNDSSVQSSGKLFENYYAYRVFDKQISYSNEKVYNFSVEDVDSYIVNGVTVHNCKGITVYRDGSRSGVLISDSDKKENEKKDLFADNHAPKRPKRLKAEIIRFQNNLEKWIAVIGLLDGRPYEIFTGKLENGLSKVPNSITECEVVKVRNKNGEKRYDLEYIDSDGEKQNAKGLNYNFDPEYWNYAKMISSTLRHGMPMIYVLELVQTLNLDDEHLNTWKNGVARVIKKYIKNGEKGKGKCPECGCEILQYIEGCLTCAGCGSSRCS